MAERASGLHSRALADLDVLPGRRLQAVHQVREFNGVTDEEHRDIVANLQHEAEGLTHAVKILPDQTSNRMHISCHGSRRVQCREERTKSQLPSSV